MALKIRLARGGAKKRPYYSIVVADVRSPRDGRFIEKIGRYNPLLAKTDEKRVQYDEDRVKHWLSVGAKPTDRVARFLAANDLVKWEHGDNPNKAKPGAKAQEREEEKRAKADAAKTAAEEPAEEPAVEDAPPAEPAAEETPTEEKAE